MQNAWAGKALVYHRHTQIPGIINLSKKKKKARFMLAYGQRFCDKIGRIY